jgi:hypothetical protein
MNSLAKTTLPLLVLTLLSSCSSTNTVSSADPSVDFSQIRTYNFAAVPNTDGQQYQSLETGYLQTAVSRELNSRGLSQSAEPDVLVNFSIDTQEKVVSRQVPSSSYGVGYDPFYDVYYDDWGRSHETRIDQYTEGKLDIDLIDPQARKMIWQGSTKGRLTQKDYENAEVTLNAAVIEIFSQYPVAQQAK